MRSKLKKGEVFEKHSTGEMFRIKGYDKSLKCWLIEPINPDEDK